MKEEHDRRQKQKDGEETWEGEREKEKEYATQKKNLPNHDFLFCFPNHDFLSFPNQKTEKEDALQMDSSSDVVLQSTVKVKTILPENRYFVLFVLFSSDTNMIMFPVPMHHLCPISLSPSPSLPSSVPTQ